MSIDRRTFLSATLFMSVGGAATLVISCRDAQRGTVQAQIELAGHFRDLPTIEIVGLEAIEMLPEGADAERLVELVAPERGPLVLQREIRDQYARGETVKLRGWSLALTEVRIYALVALARTIAPPADNPR